MENRPLERRLHIAQLIQQKLKGNRNIDGIILTFEELKKESLLTDLQTLEITLEKISRDLGSDFHYKLLGRSGISSAADHENRNPSKIFDSMRIDVEDRSGFYLYVNNLEKELKKIEKEYIFFLNNDRELTRDGDSGIYKLEDASLRYKLIYLLGKEKKFMSASKLAQRFKVNNPERIRKTIDQMRGMIKKKLNVSGHTLIESDDGMGYRIKNLVIK